MKPRNEIATFERFDITLPRDVALACSAPGRDAEPWIIQAMLAPALARQLVRLDPALVADELRQWGAWSDDELAQHHLNLRRIVWLAASNIREGGDE
jgi:hypothetical protein